MRIPLKLALLALTVPAVAAAGACRHHGMHHVSFSAAPAVSAAEPQPPAAQLVGAYCTQCPLQPSTGQHAAEEWPQVVSRMLGHMRHFAGGSGAIASPTRQEVAAILDYLQKNASN